MIIDNVDFVMFDRLYIVIARSLRKVYTVNNKIRMVLRIEHPED